MQLHTLRREQYLPRPLERIFPFFERPENLALITPPRLGFRLLSPGPVEMCEGRTIDYTVRLIGMPVRWRSLISTYQPPHCFVDEQIQGPYAYWRHTHWFAPSGGGTLIRDQVRYALPAWLPRPAGDLLHRLYVAPALNGIFDYRRDMFAKLFDGTEADVPPTQQPELQEA